MENRSEPLGEATAHSGMKTQTRLVEPKASKNSTLSADPQASSKPLGAWAQSLGSEAGCYRLVPGPEGLGLGGEAMLTPVALLPEVTPAPHTPLHPHSHTPLAPALCIGPTSEASASSCHPTQLSGAPSLPADQKRGEGLKSVCRGPGLPSGEAAQPFQAEVGL